MRSCNRRSKQPFIIDNRAGDAGRLRSGRRGRREEARPTGYTAAVAASRYRYRLCQHLQKTPYDPDRDFAPDQLGSKLVPSAASVNADPSFPGAANA